MSFILRIEISEGQSISYHINNGVEFGMHVNDLLGYGYNNGPEQRYRQRTLSESYTNIQLTATINNRDNNMHDILQLMRSTNGVSTSYNMSLIEVNEGYSQVGPLISYIINGTIAIHRIEPVFISMSSFNEYELVILCDDMKREYSPSVNLEPDIPKVKTNNDKMKDIWDNWD